MRVVLAAAVGVVLLHLLLAGTAVDVGAAGAAAGAAWLLVACGAGLCLARGACARSRRRDAVLLVLLVLLRGPLADALFALLPFGVEDTGTNRAGLTVQLVSALTLVPPGLLLGRLLRPVMGGPLALSFLGVAAGVLLQRVGAAGWLAPWLGVTLGVAAIWALTRGSPLPRTPASSGAGREGDGASASPSQASPAAALLLGSAVALALVSFRRLIPAYVVPSCAPEGDALLALLVPAAVVSWPAAVLASGGWATRLVGGVGALLLALALWVTAGNLGLYENAIAQVALTRQLHDLAARSGGLLQDWHLWLLSFAGYSAAALGVTSGAFRGPRAVGMATLGAGLALGAEYALIAEGGALADDPVRAPLRLMLVAASCALLVIPLMLGGRRPWLALMLALPVAILPFLEWRFGGGAPWFETGALRAVPGFDEVRRPGEYAVEAFARTLAGDVTVYSTPGLDSHAVEGRAAFSTTLSPRTPMFRLGSGGDFLTPLEADGAHAHGESASGEVAPAEAELEKFLGVRVAGRALHAQHPPLGAEGSVGRMLRLFARPGRALVCGIGSELVAADLRDAGLSEDMVVASAIPLGTRSLHLLLDHLGSAGWQAARIADPQLIARDSSGPGFETIVLAPAYDALPGTSALFAEESLERLAALLTPEGRCLAWLDTASLDGRALRARVGAFGEVFGEQSAAFVEPRELDPPLVLLVGWRSPLGHPSLEELNQALPCRDTTGFRARLVRVENIAALLLRDGPGMQQAASLWPRHRRSRPIESCGSGDTGWAAVARIADPAASLARVVSGGPSGIRTTDAVFSGLARHSRYRYRLLDLNETLLEIKPDVDWEAFEAECADYARAAADNPEDPLLQSALAALLEQLAVVGDFSRFVRVYQACGADRMHSWRLALQEAWVRRQGLDEAGFEDALRRARDWAGEFQAH